MTEPGAAVAEVSLDRVGIFLLALVVVVAHVATNLWGPYGLHRDELLYLAMGTHLRFWAMDFPPAIAVLANASRALLGDGIAAVRIFPAMAHAALIVSAAVMTREWGGGPWRQRLAALAVLTSPYFLRSGTLLQPVVFDQLTWTLALLCLTRLVATDDGRWWVGIGVALGLGLLMKFSIAFIAVPMVVATIITPERRWLRTRWPWAAVLLVLVLGAPSVVGQIVLGFPVRAQMASLQGSQLERMTAGRFLGEQLLLGPAIVLAGAGAVALLWRPLERWRAVALTCLGAFVLLLLAHGKSYYVVPIYPALVAAGAAALERTSPLRLRTGLTGALATLTGVYGVVVLPEGLPILAAPRMATYVSRLGLAPITRTNLGQQLQLPQDYADMLGWRDVVGAVADVYRRLPPADRADAVIIASNYGEAGAIDFYGPALGLPPVVSAAGSYWFFGPGARDGRVAITVGIRPADLQPFYEQIEDVARFDSYWMVPEERSLPLLIARKPKATLAAVWPSLAGRN